MVAGGWRWSRCNHNAKRLAALRQRRGSRWSPIYAVRRPSRLATYPPIMYRLLRPARLLSLRLASQVIAHAQRPPRLLPNHGQDRNPGTIPTTHPFSTTAPVKASEDDNFLGPLRDSPLLKQIAGNPEALGALQDFMSLMVKNGM